MLTWPPRSREDAGRPARPRRCRRSGPAHHRPDHGRGHPERILAAPGDPGGRVRGQPHPVREALRKLQASGTVSLVPHRGAFVRGPTARGIPESYLVRAELEGFAAELAAEWITDPQVARLRDAVDRGRDAVEQHRDGPDAHDAAGRIWAEANDAFHETVQEAAANTRLVQSIHDVHRSFPRDLTWTALAEDARLLDANIAQHVAVLEALAARTRSPPGAR